MKAAKRVKALWHVCTCLVACTPQPVARTHISTSLYTLILSLSDWAASPILAVNHRDGCWLVYAIQEDPRLPAAQCVAVLTEPGPMRPMVSGADVPTILAGMSRAVGRAMRARECACSGPGATCSKTRSILRQ